MFGIILFWLQYIVAGVVLYHILKCIYVKEKKTDSGYYTKYIRTENDKRLKHPLWLVMVFIISFLIPIWNWISLSFYLGFRMISDRGSEYNPYYCKSIFTKEY